MHSVSADIRLLFAHPWDAGRYLAVVKRYARPLCLILFGWILALSYLFYDFTIYGSLLINHLVDPPYTYELLFHIFMVVLSPPLFLYIGIQDYRKTGYLLELEAMTEKWRATYDSVPDIIFILDRDHRVTNANHAARSALGEDIVGKPFCYSRITGAPNCADPAAALRPSCPHRISLDRNASVQREVRDGLIYDATCTPVIGGNGEIIGSVNILRDVTEQRLLEAQFRQAQKMESIGRFSAAIAHDFNNLLTVIKGSSAMITAPDDQSAAGLDQIKRAAERGAQMVRSITTFSRKTVQNPRTFEVDTHLRGFEPLLRQLLGKDVRIELRLDAGGMAIRGSEGGIEQVLMNLAANSRDAMPAGGAFTIETRTVESADAVRYGYTGAGPAVLLQISDTGTGMSDEAREKLFEPFFTTKPPGTGTGLGLATVYSIVQQHRGAIQVHSEQGAGTMFTICLPASQTVPAEPTIS